MSKSLEFCVTTASNPLRSRYSDRDWNAAIEIESESLFDILLKGERNFIVEGMGEHGGSINIDINLSFNKDTDFDYFASDSCIHDGTLLFSTELMRNIIERVCCAATYNSQLREPKSGDKVAYTVGNFVILNEYDGDFIHDNKPWMRERTTVLLPLKFEIKG